MKELRIIHPACLFAALVCLTISSPVGSQDPGFFLDDWQERTAEIPGFRLAEKPDGTPTVTVSIDMEQVVKKVPVYIYGNNAVTWDNGLRANATAMTDLKNLNPRVLRWPGGSASDAYFWNANYGQRPDDIPANVSPWYGMNTPNWQMSLDGYYDLRMKTNSTGIITLNYAYARYGTGPDPVAQAAHLAAEWVRYDAGRTRFWEIGNENFGSWELGYEINQATNQDGQPRFISGKLYGEHCRVFIDSLRQAAAEIGSEIRIGVVAYDAETSWDPVQTVWNEQMMPEVGHLADFLVVHSYFTPYDENSTVNTILASHIVPGRIMSAMVSDMSEAGRPMIPVTMTEWNIFAVGSMQMVSYISGVHAALTLGEFILNDYGLAARWDLVNGWNNGDDHAMFSTGGEPGVDPYNPRPAFFYMYYFQKFIGDRLVGRVVTGSSQVIAYASSFSSGECGAVLINKSTTGQTVVVETDNFDRGDLYYCYTLTGGSDNGDFSRKVYINGSGTDEAGGGPDDYKNIDAVASETAGGIIVALPPLGVVYLMVDQAELAYESSRVERDSLVIDVTFTREVDSVGTHPGFEIVANDTSLLAIDSVEIDPLDAHRIHIYLNHPVQPTDLLTISYAAGMVTAADGDPLLPFENEIVDNLLPGSPPVLEQIDTDENGAEVRLLFSKEMEIAAGETGDFELTDVAETGAVKVLSGMGIDSTEPKRILLYPADPLFAEYQLVLSYSGSGITSTDGGVLARFDSLAIENHSPGLPPEIVGASVNELGRGLDVSFSKPMNDLSEQTGAFTVTVDGAVRAVSAIESSDSEMSLLLEGVIYHGQEVRLSYYGTSVTAVDRGVLAEFTDFPIANPLEAPTVFGIPGMVDAELFMFNQGMMLELCSDEGGGSNLTSIDPGDWVEYMVDVTWEGNYKGMIRSAAQSDAGQLQIQTPDAGIIDRLTLVLPVTGGWQEWTSVPVELSLEPGLQRLRLHALTGNYNLNWLSLEPDTATNIIDLDPGEIHVYPNPATTRVTITGRGRGFTSVAVLDITGRPVLLREYPLPVSEETINLELPAGWYMMKVETDLGPSLTRLMILGD